MHSGQLAGLVCLPVGVLLDDPFRQASSQLLVLQSRLLEGFSHALVRLFL